VYAKWLWGATMTSRCWGTKRLDQVADADGKNLGPGGIAKSKYYERLRVYCMGRPDTPCCLSSLKAMSARGYLPQTEELCPDGMVPDRLRCMGSYVWCVPVTDRPTRTLKK